MRVCIRSTMDSETLFCFRWDCLNYMYWGFFSSVSLWIRRCDICCLMKHVPMHVTWAPPPGGPTSGHRRAGDKTSVPPGAKSSCLNLQEKSSLCATRGRKNTMAGLQLVGLAEKGKWTLLWSNLWQKMHVVGAMKCFLRKVKSLMLQLYAREKSAGRWVTRIAFATSGRVLVNKLTVICDSSSLAEIHNKGPLVVRAPSFEERI